MSYPDRTEPGSSRDGVGVGDCFQPPVQCTTSLRIGQRKGRATGVNRKDAQPEQRDASVSLNPKHKTRGLGGDRQRRTGPTNPELTMEKAPIPSVRLRTTYTRTCTKALEPDTAALVH